MPHKKSAKKRLRQNTKRREHNRAVKKTLKKHLKTVAEVAHDKQSAPEKLKQEAVAAIKKLDKAAARGVLHPNTVARRKSHIDRMLNRKSAASAQPQAQK
jgi:small subunit ribosomal protein S20